MINGTFDPTNPLQLIDLKKLFSLAIILYPMAYSQITYKHNLFLPWWQLLLLQQSRASRLLITATFFFIYIYVYIYL